MKNERSQNKGGFPALPLDIVVHSGGWCHQLLKIYPCLIQWGGGADKNLLCTPSCHSKTVTQFLVWNHDFLIKQYHFLIGICTVNSLLVTNPMHSSWSFFWQLKGHYLIHFLSTDSGSSIRCDSFVTKNSSVPFNFSFPFEKPNNFPVKKIILISMWKEEKILNKFANGV